MNHQFFKPLALSALLIVAVSCGKEKSEGPKPGVSGAKGLEGVLPELEGTMSVKVPRTEGTERVPGTALKTKGQQGEGQDAYSDTTYVATLADACKGAGGAFVAESLDCACPGASEGAVYSAKSQACVTPTRDTSCTTLGETFMAALERRGTEDFITSCLSKIQSFEGTVTSIDIPRDRPAKAREVAAVLDSQLATRPVGGSVPGLFDRAGWASSFVVIYGASPFDSRAFEMKPYVGDPNDSHFSDGKRAVHVTSAEGLSALFQYGPVKQEKVKNLPSVALFSKEDREVLQPLFSTVSEHLPSSSQSTFAPELGGCTQLCNVRSTLATLADGRSVWRERVLVWGQTFSDSISVGKNDTSVEARVVLGVDGAVSAIEVRKSVQEGSTLKQVRTAFDANGKMLGEEKKADIDLTTLSNLQSTRSLTSLGTDTPVVVCNDYFYVGEENHEFTDSIVFGPYASSNPFGTGSLFGWEENKEAALGNFLGGLNQDFKWPASDGFSGFLTSPFSGLTGTRLRMIPVASERCQPGSTFLRTVLAKTQGKARIVAALTSTFENAKDCKAKYGKALEEGTQLWVVTSGLSGLPGRENFRCPQALGPSSNLLVVAGDLPPNTGGRSFAAPDTGEDYVDLAVVAFQQRHPPAVVARAAAAIQAAHGDVLSNALIRLSLLLSVDLPKSRGIWTPYPSRSGGFLNTERALKAAAFIATQLSPAQREKFGASEAKAVIEHLFTDAAEAQFRTNLVSERKGLVL